jgi:small subunit ribosomal protein S8
MSKRYRRGKHVKCLSSNTSFFFGRIVSDLRVGSLCKQDFVEIPFSDFSERFVRFLYKKGLLTRFFIHNKDQKFFILVVLKYFKDKGFLDEIKVFDKPSKRVFYTYRKLFFLSYRTSEFRGGIGIFSTVFGIMDVNMCLRFRVGGTFLCFIPIL